MPIKVCDENTYPFPNFNDCTVVFFRRYLNQEPRTLDKTTIDNSPCSFIANAVEINANIDIRMRFKLQKILWEPMI